MNQAEISVGDGVPLEPLVGSVGTPIAILEHRQLRVVHDRGLGADRGLAVVGVDEVQPRLRQQLLSRDPQRALPGWIQADKIPVKVGDAEQVLREREEPVELLLGPFPLDEQANLAADRRQHPQQIRVGLADLAAEELHDPEDLGAPHHGKPKAACSPHGRRQVARGKFGSRTTSGIQAGWRLDHTRPGRPTPGREDGFAG
jgi:hypothetical protein